jgi:hypothetical protein
MRADWEEERGGGGIQIVNKRTRTRFTEKKKIMHIHFDVASAEEKHYLFRPHCFRRLSAAEREREREERKRERKREGEQKIHSCPMKRVSSPVSDAFCMLPRQTNAVI